MKCGEAEDLLEAYGTSTEAFGLAVDAVVKVIGGSLAEFSSALKLAESSMDDRNAALRAADLHIVKHQCQPTDGP
jgi:hypothetical protein